MHLFTWMIICVLTAAVIVQSEGKCPRPDSLVKTADGNRSLCARMFEHSHVEENLSCGGSQLEVAIGETVEIMPHGYLQGNGNTSWNDKISSLVVREGCTLNTYWDRHFKRWKAAWKDVVSRLHKHGWNDKISSYACSCDFAPINCNHDLHDEWQLVNFCDATQAHPNRAGKCSVDLQIGVQNVVTNTRGGGRSDTIGISVGMELLGIFSAGLQRSKTTSFNWERTTSELFTRMQSYKIEADNEAGKVTKISQVVGVCGQYLVKTVGYKIVHE